MKFGKEKWLERIGRKGDILGRERDGVSGGGVFLWFLNVLFDFEEIV